MLHLTDYLIIISICFLSVFIGFTPKLTFFLKGRLSKTKTTKFNSTTEHEPFVTTKTTSVQAEQKETRTNFIMLIISLVMGFQTTISIVGLPLEFYTYSFKSLQMILCLALAPIIMAYFFVPFLYKIKSASLYDYFTDKFDGHLTVKYFTILIAVSFQFLFASCVLFSTAISILQIVPDNLEVELWQVCAVIGLLSAVLAFFGLQSVVWANFVQYVIMVACMVTFIFLGIINYESQETQEVGRSRFSAGFWSMWSTTQSTQRNKIFIFKENLRERYTFWNCLIGLMFNTIPSYCLTQQSFMRIKQAKNAKSAKYLLLSIAPFGMANLSLLLLFGYVIFSYFAKCADPLALNLVANQSQLLTKFLTQFYDKYVGLLGLYIALLLSSSIGTLSSVLAALAVTLKEEVFKKIFFKVKRTSDDDTETIGKRKRLLSMKQNEEIYLEEMLTLQLRRDSLKNVKKTQLVIKQKLGSSDHSKLITKQRILTFCLILTSCLILIILASLFSLIHGSLIGIAFSMLNAIHGPVLFNYLTARFNEYSMKRHKYATHRSTTSKLGNFKFNHVHVVLSGLISILFIQFLFIGKLVTSSIGDQNVKDFYTSDKMKITTRFNTTDESLVQFCKYDKTQLNLINNITTSSSGDHQPLVVDSIWYYLFAISFNWYPFLGFLMCVVQVFFFNLLAIFVNLISSKILRIKK